MTLQFSLCFLIFCLNLFLGGCQMSSPKYYETTNFEPDYSSYSHSSAFVGMLQDPTYTYYNERKKK
jgi:hypothetical protein